MKFSVRAAFTGLLGYPLCVLAAPQRILYKGGDGSSIEKAVLIEGASEETGVHAEYAYIEKHDPGSHTGRQSLQQINGRAYDVLEYTTADGKKKVIYFDISGFFGK